MSVYERQEHPIKPIYDINSKVLILGSFPSVKSREGAFFYHHPQNRFWKVLARVLNHPLPQSIEEKREMLLYHGIALWDVIQSCEIKGSSDTSIRNVVPNDFSDIFRTADIKKIYANGMKSYKLYQKHCLSITKREIIKLPSTSPANAASTLEKLVEEWWKLRDDCLN